MYQILKVCVAMCVGAIAASSVWGASRSVVVVWNDAALGEVRLAKLGPPMVSRALAVAHTCMYEAWVPFDTQAAPTTVLIPRRPQAEQIDANKATALSFAAYRCLINLFPAGSARLDAQMRALGYDPLDTSTDQTTPQGIGNTAASAVIASRRNDGSNQYGDLFPGAYKDYTNYAPTNAPMPFCMPSTIGICPLNISDPYHWQPLINNAGVTQIFVGPQWERVLPFALTSGAQFDNVSPFSDGPLYAKNPGKYKRDVNSIVSFSRDLTQQQKLIVEYWADGPASELPPGHWSLFAQFISMRDAHSIDDDVKMFFAMQNASFDSGIAAWHLKRKFEGVRPITAIRYSYQGKQIVAWGGPGRPSETIDGGKWSPYNPGSNLSPAFPGYVSGHSTFSASSASILRSFTGTDTFGYAVTIPANFGRVETGVPAVPTTMSYATLDDAVQEAGMSRLYAGIHYPDDNTDGQSLGNLAAQVAWTKAFALFNGLPPATYATNSNVSCMNGLLGGQTYANVDIPAGTRCALLGTRVNGNLTIGVGASVDMSNVTVNGNVTAQNALSVRIAGGVVARSLQINSSQMVSIAGTSAAALQVVGTTGSYVLRDLHVDGDLQIASNLGSGAVARNVVGHALRCSSNATLTTTIGNSAASKEGQCASQQLR